MESEEIMLLLKEALEPYIGIESVESVAESQVKPTLTYAEFLLYDTDNHLHIVKVEKVP